jgi:hypothetical protein
MKSFLFGEILMDRAVRVATFASSAFVALTLASHTALPQQGGTNRAVVDGVVTDTSLAPLGDVSVGILGSAIQVRSLENGRFQILDLRPGSYRLFARRVGFEPALTQIEVGQGDTVRISLALTPTTTALDTVRVRGEQLTPRMREFEERRKFGVGQFMTGDQIHARNPLTVTDLMRTFLGVKIMETGGGGGSYRYYLASARGSIMTVPAPPEPVPGLGGVRNPGIQAALGCFMEIYIDDVHISTPIDLNTLPPPASIAGIEVYSGVSEIPLQFRGLGAMCGVVLIWTKVGN